MVLERHFERTISCLQPGDHLCCIYEDLQQRQEILVRCLLDGLPQGQKQIFLSKEKDPEKALHSLTFNIDDSARIQDACARGQMKLLPAEEVFLPGSRFDPQPVLDWIEREQQKALAQGYQAVRFAVEMDWASPGVPGVDQLIEYEARINAADYFHSSIILCLYNRRSFAPDLLQDLLLTHPLLAIGPCVYDNFYYLPPEKLLQQDRAAARFDQSLNNLIRSQQQEWKLEQERHHLARQVEEQLNSLAQVNQRLDCETRQRAGTELALEQANDTLRESEEMLNSWEMLLRKSEAQFRSLVEQSPIGIVLADEQGNVIEWNACVQQIYHLPPEQALGRPIWDVRTEFLPREQQNQENYDQLKTSMQNFFSTGKAPWLYQLDSRELTWPDGQTRCIQRVRFPIRTEQGFMLASFIRDITEQHRVELELEQYRQRLEGMVEQRTGELQQRTAELQHEVHERQLVESVLRESEGRYRALVNQSPLSILVAQENRYVFANPAIVQRLGYSSAYDLVGKSVLDTIAPESREAVQSRGGYRLGAGGSDLAITAYLRKDGSIYYSENTAVPILYQGRPAMLIIGQDVSERMRYEQQLEASLAEKEVMLREIHHRVKNNLNVIIALINLQKDTQSDPQVLQVFKELQTRAHTMALVHESLYRSPNLAKIDFAKYLQTLVDYLYSAYGPASAGTGNPLAGAVSLPGVSYIDLRVEAENVSLKIETAIPCGLIVNELVTNSLKYAFPPGTIAPQGEPCTVIVRLSRTDGPDRERLTLMVLDNGVGLPPGLNWRAAPSLGLQLVQILARQLGGQIELDSSNGSAWFLTFSERR